MFRQLRVVCVLAAILLAVRAVSAQSAEVEDTTFFMTFVPNIQFAQMYVGIEKGYFEEAGFNLTLEYGNEPDGVELIALGERKFGLIAGEQVIIARANARPVVSVYEWWQQYPIAIVTSDNSGILQPADLAGKRVGLPGRFGATYSGLVAFLTANDLTEQDVDLREIGFNAPEVMCVGGVDAAAVYGNNEPLQMMARVNAGDCDAMTGVTAFFVADYVDLVSNGVVTSEAMIQEQPEQVAAMVAAFDRAVRDVINNPAEAYLLSAPYIENLPMTDELQAALESAAAEQAAFLETNPDREAVAASRIALYDALTVEFDPALLLQLQTLISTVQLWDADRVGYADVESWEKTQDTLVQMGFVQDPIDVEQAFTNAFLP